MCTSLLPVHGTIVGITVAIARRDREKPLEIRRLTIVFSLDQKSQRKPRAVAKSQERAPEGSVWTASVEILPIGQRQIGLELLANLHRDQ